MSLCPSTVSGDAKAPYFLLSPAVDAVLQEPEVVPAPGEPAAGLVINNGASPNTYVKHYMVNTTGGGLTANHYQAFLYGASVGGDNVAPIFDAYGNGNDDAILSFNAGIPLDPSRVGYVTGTGAPQNVAVPSVSAGSIVGFAYFGGAAAAAAVPVPVMTPGTGFAVTLPAGAIYAFNVYG